MRGRRSLVAGVNALFRARESERPSASRILLDPFARRLAEHDPRVLAIRGARLVLPGLGRLVEELQVAHCVRHRTIDALLLEAIERGGYRQVVIVGAGYDMRASRFAATLGALAEEVRWVEVDEPETLARKRRLLEGVPGVNARVERVAVDLLEGSLADALRRAGESIRPGRGGVKASPVAAGFDPGAPACFVLEGIIHYLDPRALDALLAAIRASSPRVLLLVSFIESGMYARAPALFVRLVKILREIPRLHFTAQGLEALARGHGLEAREMWTLEQQILRFAPEGRGRKISLGQDVALLEGQVL